MKLLDKFKKWLCKEVYKQNALLTGININQERVIEQFINTENKLRIEISDKSEINKFIEKENISLKNQLKQKKTIICQNSKCPDWESFDGAYGGDAKRPYHKGTCSLSQVEIDSFAFCTDCGHEDEDLKQDMIKNRNRIN